MDNLKEIITPLDDPYKSAKQKQEETDKAAIELQRLCYETFHTFPDGKRLYEWLRDKYLLGSCYSPVDNNANELALYWEGFRECIRGIHALGEMHRKRIAEVNQ